MKFRFRVTGETYHPLILQYVEYLEKEKHILPRYTYSTKNILRKMWLRIGEEPIYITENQLAEYLYSNQGNNFWRTDSFYKWVIPEIKKFFRYLLDLKLITISPAENLKIPKLGNKFLYKQSTIREVRRINAYMGQGHLNHQYVALWYLVSSNAFLAFSTLAEIKYADIDFDEQYLRVKNKIIPLTDEAINAIKRCRLTQNIKCDYLFYMEGGRKCTPTNLNDRFHRIIEKTIKKGRVNPTTLKLLLLEVMLKSGMSIFMIRYMTGISLPRLQKIISNISPTIDPLKEYRKFVTYYNALKLG